ncbi:MAG TPA: thiamine pyrophosphate-binding protein [Dehalococcoidia bacterium]|nr:thiamine pyrophosphate-binding protein [Dehalococcoidia bacterium]
MPRMTGNQFLVEALKAYDVSHLFYVPSVLGGAMPLIQKAGIKTVITHGEKAAAYMADGYARTSHKPGIALCQDIGTTNLAAGLRDPYMACSPVIAITGGQGDLPRYRHAYQNAEDFGAWEGVTKANFSVDTVERLPDLLRQAFRTATSGTPGPVHLELRGNAGQMLEREADFDLMFDQRFVSYPAFRPEPDAGDIGAAVELLARAERPIIVAGGGVAASGAAAEVVKLAERLSIPVATSLNAKEIIPDEHPLAVGVPGSYSRWSASRAVSEADLVLFIGSHTGGQVTNFWQLPKIGTPVIQVDIEPDELGRNYPNAVSIHGDAKVAVQRLIDAAEAQPPREGWLARVQGFVREYWAESDPLRYSDAVPVRPERLCRELNEWLPADATLVCDTFHAAIWTAQMVRLKAGQHYVRCAGSLGWGLPGTLGVKAASPDKPVIGFTGDAGFYYHVGELETAVRNGINAVIVVNNNYSGGVGETSPFEHSVSLAKIAQDFGCFGVRVEKPDEVRGALDAALASGRPAVVEVVSDPSVRAKRAWSPGETDH